MLISQAKAENMTFITHDSLLPYYQEKCIVFV
jgi:PIN domain nuclease of toxin-antitoxin system